MLGLNVKAQVYETCVGDVEITYLGSGFLTIDTSVCSYCGWYFPLLVGPSTLSL